MERLLKSDMFLRETIVGFISSGLRMLEVWDTLVYDKGSLRLINSIALRSVYKATQGNHIKCSASLDS